MEGVRHRLARGQGQARGTSLAAVLMAVLSLLLGAHPALAQKPRAERPTYAVGEQWLLKDGVYELIKVEKDRYIFAATTGRQIHLTKDLALVSVLRDRVWKWDLSLAPELSWPLEVGKWGVIHRATLKTRENRSGVPVRVTWEVKAYEGTSAWSAGCSRPSRSRTWSTSRPATHSGPGYRCRDRGSGRS
jgi:hypothetical protein